MLQLLLFYFIIKGLCNNCLEGGGGGGVGKLEGGIGENDNKREGGLDVKFNSLRSKARSAERSEFIISSRAKGARSV